MGQISCKIQMENPNPSLYSEKLWEEAQGHCTFLRSKKAAVIFRFVGGLSTMCSFLIIYIILKSPTKLSYIYHRIMFGMSFCQIFATAPFVFTTLAMPAPGDYWTDIANVQGTRLGNIYTCTAQGFFIRFGEVSAWAYFSMGLGFYYACAIGFRMTIETMRKYIEPLVHIVPILLGLYSALPALFMGGYNVGHEMPACTVTPKPWFCDNHNSTVACVRGGRGEQLETNLKMLRHYDPPFAAIMLLCLFILCISVYLKDRQMATLLKGFSVDDDVNKKVTISLKKPSEIIQISRNIYLLANGEEFPKKKIHQLVKDQYADTKVIMSQTAIYFLVYVIIFFDDYFYTTDPYENSYKSQIVDVSYMLGVGFYQLLIFIFHKVFNQRRSYPNLPIFEGIAEIFQGGPGNETFVIDRMHQVKVVREFEDKYEDSQAVSEDGDENELLVSSCGVSANYGSLSSAPTNRSLLLSSLWRTNSSTNNTPSNMEYIDGTDGIQYKEMTNML